MSQTAYILLNCDVGKDELVKSKLKNVDEIKEVKRTYGVYDIIVKLKTPNHSSLWDVISKKIKTQDNIRSALTLSVIDQ